MMSKRFNEFDRDRCDHCGQWRERCSLCTPPIEVENYGWFAICQDCFNKHPEFEYWDKWIKEKMKMKQKNFDK
jgi:hypothetical protein